MIDASTSLPIVRQAQLLDLSRSAVYYRPQPTSDTDLALMRRIDELHLDHPFAGARMLRDLLRQDGFAVGRKHVATLMRTMGIEALYRKADTSRRHPEHPDLSVSAAGLDHRSAESGLGDGHHLPADGARLRLSRGGAGLGHPPHSGVATVEQPDRRLLRRGVGGGDHALRRAGDHEHRPGQPIHRQRVHRCLTEHAIRISMDGKGCWRDNVFVERLWKTIKYEEVYLHAYDTVSAAKDSLPDTSTSTIAGARIRARPANARRGILQSAAARRGGLNRRAIT